MGWLFVVTYVQRTLTPISIYAGTTTWRWIQKVFSAVRNVLWTKFGKPVDATVSGLRNGPGCPVSQFWGLWLGGKVSVERRARPRINRPLGNKNKRRGDNPYWLAGLKEREKHTPKISRQVG